MTFLVQAAHFAADASTRFLAKTYEDTLWLGREIKRGCIENAHYVGRLFEKIIANAPAVVLIGCMPIQARAISWVVTYLVGVATMIATNDPKTAARLVRAPVFAAVWDFIQLFLMVVRIVWQAPIFDKVVVLLLYSVDLAIIVFGGCAIGIA